MELEKCLIEEITKIKALMLISKKIYNLINENYYVFKAYKQYLDEIFALNDTIQSIAYCIRIRYREYYQKIDKTYKNNFSYKSAMFGNF